MGGISEEEKRLKEEVLKAYRKQTGKFGVLTEAANTLYGKYRTQGLKWDTIYNWLKAATVEGTQEKHIERRGGAHRTVEVKASDVVKEACKVVRMGKQELTFEELERRINAGRAKPFSRPTILKGLKEFNAGTKNPLKVTNLRTGTAPKKPGGKGLIRRFGAYRRIA